MYLYDVKPLFESNKEFLPLKDENLFREVKVDADGKGISWNCNIRLSLEELLANGVNFLELDDDDEITEEEIQAAEKALKEYEKDKKTYSIEEVKKMLDL